VLGRVWSARPLRASVGAEGANAGPGATFWIDSARRADADATAAWPIAALADCPALRPAPPDAIPRFALFNANDCGAGGADRRDCADAGLNGASAGVGDAGAAADRAARRGGAVRAACMLSDGRLTCAIEARRGGAGWMDAASPSESVATTRLTGAALPARCRASRVRVIARLLGVGT